MSMVAAKAFISGGQTEDLHAAVRHLAECLRRNVSVCIPAAVVSYDRATHVAEVVPLVRNVVFDKNYNAKDVTGESFSVPVHFPCFGGFTIDVPLYAGDRGWVIALDVDKTTLHRKKGDASMVNVIPEKDMTETEVLEDEPQKALVLMAHDFGQGVFFPSSMAAFHNEKIVNLYRYDRGGPSGFEKDKSGRYYQPALAHGSTGIQIGEVANGTYLETQKGKVVTCVMKDGRASISMYRTWLNLCSGFSVLYLYENMAYICAGRDIRKKLGISSYNRIFNSLGDEIRDRWLGECPYCEVRDTSITMQASAETAYSSLKVNNSGSAILDNTRASLECHEEETREGARYIGRACELHVQPNRVLASTTYRTTGTRETSPYVRVGERAEIASGLPSPRCFDLIQSFFGNFMSIGFCGISPGKTRNKWTGGTFVKPMTYEEYVAGFVTLVRSGFMLNVPRNTTFGGKSLGGRAYKDYKARKV